MILKFIHPSKDFRESIKINYQNNYYNISQIGELLPSQSDNIFSINNLLFLFIHSRFKTAIKQLGGMGNFVYWDDSSLLLCYAIISCQNRITCAGKKIRLHNSVLIENARQHTIIQNILKNIDKLCFIEEV